MADRITKKDINSIQDAIDFISTNTGGVDEEKQVRYYNDLTRRLNKIYKKLSD